MSDADWVKAVEKEIGVHEYRWTGRSPDTCAVTSPDGSSQWCGLPEDHPIHQPNIYGPMDNSPAFDLVQAVRERTPKPVTTERFRCDVDRSGSGMVRRVFALAATDDGRDVLIWTWASHID